MVIKTSSEVQGQIKGAALREFLAWYVHRNSHALLAEKIDKLAPEIMHHLDFRQDNLGVLSSQWYPARVIHALLDSIFAGVPPNEREDIIREGARAVMQATLQGIYKLLFKTMMSPDRYAKYSQKLWDRYYDCGIMKKESPKPFMQTTTISDWASHHPVICDLNYEGSRYIFEAMGCKDVTVRRLGCVSTGQAECSFIITWSG